MDNSFNLKPYLANSPADARTELRAGGSPLARMIEGAIKYRDPKKPDRKLSWRQELRSRLVNDSGRFIWLIRNPINTMDSGKWIMDNEKQKTLDLGPVDPEVLRNIPYRPCPALTELFPDAGLPKQYLDLVDRQWLTNDLNLFEATPAGDFATKVEGFPVRLPLAVMPPAYYERWRARGGHPAPEAPPPQTA